MSSRVNLDPVDQSVHSNAPRIAVWPESTVDRERPL